MERTLVIIKPDAVKKKLTGRIIDHFECQGLELEKIVMKIITKSEAKSFYSEHKNKSFYEDLISFISSGKSILIILKGKDAIIRSREIIGYTDFKKANPGTIRRCYAESITSNAVHGSDSYQNAMREISFFFPDYNSI